MSLSWVHQRLLIGAVLLLPGFSVGLRLFGCKKVWEWIGQISQGPRSPITPQEIDAIGSLVNSAAIYSIGPDKCLVRSLYLLWLLRRRGITGELRIGIELLEGQLTAHAWVEVGGRPIGERRETTNRYAILDRLGVYNRDVIDAEL